MLKKNNNKNNSLEQRFLTLFSEVRLFLIGIPNHLSSKSPSSQFYKPPLIGIILSRHKNDNNKQRITLGKDGDIEYGNIRAREGDFGGPLQAREGDFGGPLRAREGDG